MSQNKFTLIREPPLFLYSWLKGPDSYPSERTYDIFVSNGIFSCKFNSYKAAIRKYNTTSSKIRRWSKSARSHVYPCISWSVRIWGGYTVNRYKVYFLAFMGLSYPRTMYELPLSQVSTVSTSRFLTHHSIEKSTCVQLCTLWIFMNVRSCSNLGVLYCKP